MGNHFVSLGFLSYNPDTYEFFCNVLCQLFESLLFLAIAPVVVDSQIGFIYHKMLNVLQLKFTMHLKQYYLMITILEKDMVFLFTTRLNMIFL